jgi:hypothetical protein
VLSGHHAVRQGVVFAEISKVRRRSYAGRTGRLPARRRLHCRERQGQSSATQHEEDIIQLGELAHAAFPQIPLLGFDIVREVSTSKLFVLDANAIGYVWNFDARIKASYDFSAEAQFDGLRKAAYILAEKTQQSAD